MFAAYKLLDGDGYLFAKGSSFSSRSQICVLNSKKAQEMTKYENEETQTSFVNINAIDRVTFTRSSINSIARTSIFVGHSPPLDFVHPFKRITVGLSGMARSHRCLSLSLLLAPYG